MAEQPTNDTKNPLTVLRDAWSALANGLRVLCKGVSSVSGNAVAINVDDSGDVQTDIKSGTVTADQGSPNTAANRWPAYHTDGTNEMPAGDAVARRIYTGLADGSGEAATATADPGAGTRGLVVRLPAGDLNLGNVDIDTLPDLREESVAGVSDTTFDATTTTVTGSPVDVHNYRMGTFGLHLGMTNAPTDITIDILISCDEGSNYTKLENGPLGAWVHDDTSVGSAGIDPSLTFPVCADYLKVRITATGTGSSAKFFVSNARLKFRE